MNTKRSMAFMICLALLVGVLSFAFVQTASAQEYEVVQTVVIHVQSSDEIAAASSDVAIQDCEIIIELRWYKDKRVKVLYHWKKCQGTFNVSWKLSSVEVVEGFFSISTASGSQEEYYRTMEGLANGDQIRLQTWVNGQEQADVVTIYQDNSPIWAKIHTRTDESGACFQFTGKIDPWGVFTSGDKRYVVHLPHTEWETPWLEGPNEPTVDWHAEFYQDAELTQLRTEYWFSNVPNPCFQPPAVCDSVTLSIYSGSQIPAEGADVTVTVNAQHAEAYRIVDEQGNTLAGPTGTNQLTFHALPNVVYQAQVFDKKHGWTSEGCKFTYGEKPKPPASCTTLTADNTVVKVNEPVNLQINGENTSEFQFQINGAMVQEGAANTYQFVPKEPGTYTVTGFVKNTDGQWISAQSCAIVITVEQLPPPSSCTSLIADKTQVKVGETVTLQLSGENPFGYVFTLDTIVVKEGEENIFAFTPTEPGEYHFTGFVKDVNGQWISAQTCQIVIYVEKTPPPVSCTTLTADNTVVKVNEPVNLQINGENTSEFQFQINGAMVQEGTANTYQFVPKEPGTYTVTGFVKNTDGQWISAQSCAIVITVEQLPPPASCTTLTADNTVVKVNEPVNLQINGENTSEFQFQINGAMVQEGAANTYQFVPKEPGTYTVTGFVKNTDGQWISAQSCAIVITVEQLPPPVCQSINLSVDTTTQIPAEGADVAVTINGLNAEQYQIVGNGTVVAGPSLSNGFTIHALPNVTYQAQVYAEHFGWNAEGCTFSYSEKPKSSIAQCEMAASHYGDPGGRAKLTAWLENDAKSVVAIEKVRINWNGKGDVSYPTKHQAGPWYTNTPFTLDSRPEVQDVGFGYYKYEAWVYVSGIEEPAYCWGDGTAPDHDNVVPNPGPFAKDNPEGKFDRGSGPSRLPTVGRLPFDGGNGSDKVELIFWAFEKEGRGLDAKITAIANKKTFLARIGMDSVSNFVKFDGVEAREGIVYGLQIGEHGPWSPLFCPKRDNNPTTITVHWAAGGQTWLDDGAAYGDCWWLTVAAAMKGLVTIDENVATYLALQPVIDWNGHRNNNFSLVQDKVTGQGPRMQDEVIGLQAMEWQGPVVPESVPADFWNVVQSWQPPQ